MFQLGIGVKFKKNLGQFWPFPLQKSEGKKLFVQSPGKKQVEKLDIFSCGINYLPYFAADMQDLSQSVAVAAVGIKNMGQLTRMALKLQIFGL